MKFSGIKVHMYVHITQLMHLHMYTCDGMSILYQPDIREGTIKSISHMYYV